MHRRSAINTHTRRGAQWLLLAALVASPIALAGGTAANAATRTHDSTTPTLMAVPADDPTLMAVPDGHATLMPVPGGASMSDGHADDSMDAMSGMDSHGTDVMRTVPTPDAPTRRAVLAGFAAVNLLVLGAAAFARRRGAGKQRRIQASPARNPCISNPNGGAA